MAATPGTYGGDVYGGGYYGGGVQPMPRLHVFVAFDRPGYGRGGVITGDTATCEGLGAWVGYDNCDLTVTDVPSRVYTGEHCLRAVAQADGDMQVSAFGLGEPGAIEPGRTYLLWVHVSAEEQPRDVRIELLWKSHTDVFIGAGYRIQRERSGRYTRIGVLAKAPPAATRLDVGVDWLACVAGEVHYLDCVTCDDVGTDIAEHVDSWQAELSGRNNVLDQTDSGSAKITLRNVDGRFTPGRSFTTLAPYAGNIKSGRRVWILAEFAGILYAIFSGFSRRWMQAVPKGVGPANLITLDCADAFRRLTGATLSSPYREEVMSDGPLAYLPLAESAESAAAGDLVVGAPAALRFAAGGGGGTQFGAETALPVLITGQNADGGSSSLAFNADDDLGARGGVLDLRYAGGVPPVAAIGWTVELWIVPPAAPPALAQIVFRHVVPAGLTDYLSGFQIVIMESGQLRVVTGGSETVATTAGSICTARPHHVALTYGPGGTYGTARLYVNGNLTGTKVLTGNPMPAGSPQIAQLGGAMSDITSAPAFLFTGRAAHLALYYKALSAPRILAHFDSGASGHYLETEADRVIRIARYGGWPAEDLRIDRGLTPLVPNDWSSGANPTALMQDNAAHGGASVVTDATGKLFMPNRHRYVNHVETVGTFRVAWNTEAEGDDFAPILDDESIRNEIEIERVGGAKIMVRDQISIDENGRTRGDPIPLGAAFDDEALFHGQWRLARDAQGHTRVDSIVFRADTAPADLFPMLLPREFGDRILLEQLPEEAPAVADDALIGRVTHGSAENVRTWRTVLNLEAAVIDPMLVLDDSVYGYLDRDTSVLGY